MRFPSIIIEGSIIIWFKLRKPAVISFILILLNSQPVTLVVIVVVGRIVSHFKLPDSICGLSVVIQKVYLLFISKNGNLNTPYKVTSFNWVFLTVITCLTLSKIHVESAPRLLISSLSTCPEQVLDIVEAIVRFVVVKCSPYIFHPVIFGEITVDAFSYFYLGIFIL